MHGHKPFDACFGSFRRAEELPCLCFPPRRASLMKARRSPPLEDCVFLWGKMSDVRLSNGSPTLERPDARVPEHPKPSACRSLFGVVDHEKLSRDFNKNMREMREAASAKWGFDFVDDKPMPNGRFEWELVDSNQVPDFYRDKKGGCSGSGAVDLNGNHSCLPTAPSEENVAAGVESECSEQCTGLRKRPACHDPTAQSKKSRNGPEEVSCPNRSHSVEHTPRKPSPKRQT